MGLIINEKGLKSNSGRKRSDKAPSCNKKKLQHILDLVNYFLRQFILVMSEIMRPVRELLKKDWL